jgi:hypothetical protein
MSKRIWLLVARAGLAVLLIVGTGGELRAQSYISPLIGFDFGGDSGCPTITNCEDKHVNFGVGLGRLGPVLGFETEFAYAKDFFGTAPGLSSSVLTVMGNVMLVPAIGPVRPYGLIGLGIMRSHVEFTPAALISTENTDIGWDVGGGVFIFLGDHLGLRGDIRHFHSFQGVTIGSIVVGDNKLDFGRASAALVLKF